MPPNTDAGVGSSTTPKSGSKGNKTEEDFKLVWAILGQLRKLGKIGGINWEEVKDQIGANTVKTTKNRYYDLRGRMEKQGFGLPDTAEGAGKIATIPSKTTTPKTKATPKKRKEEADGDAEGFGSDGTPTPSKKPKKTPGKTAKQLKAEMEAAKDEPENGIKFEGDLEGPNGETAHVEAETEVDS